MENIKRLRLLELLMVLYLIWLIVFTFYVVNLGSVIVEYKDSLSGYLCRAVTGDNSISVAAHNTKEGYFCTLEDGERLWLGFKR